MSTFSAATPNCLARKRRMNHTFHVWTMVLTTIFVFVCHLSREDETNVRLRLSPTSSPPPFSFRVLFPPFLFFTVILSALCLMLFIFLSLFLNFHSLRSILLLFHFILHSLRSDLVGSSPPYLLYVCCYSASATLHYANGPGLRSVVFEPGSA